MCDRSNSRTAWKSIVLAVCLFLAIPAAALTVAVRPASHLSVTITPVDPAPKLGDPIIFLFTVTNEGASDYKPHDRDEPGWVRAESCRLMVRSQWGEVPVDPYSRDFDRSVASVRPIVIGPVVQKTLPPKGSFTVTVTLNRWALITAPGRYEVTGVYGFDKVTSKPVEITVEPRTPDQMGEYIDELKGQLKALVLPAWVEGFKVGFDGTFDTDFFKGSGGQKALEIIKARGEIVEKLMYTCDPRIIPTLLRTFYKPGGGPREVDAFLCYLPRNEETKRTLLGTAAKEGLAVGMQYLLERYRCTPEEMYPAIARSLAADNPRVWTEGIQAAKKYSSDEFMPRLIAIARDPNSGERRQAIRAIARNRTDEGVQALKALLGDADGEIRRTAAEAIRDAYLYDGDITGRRLRDDDFDESFRTPEAER